MPIFKATVEGQNFSFMVDGEPQLAGFHKTLYLEADDDNYAVDQAIDRVRNELLTKKILTDDPSDQSLLDVDDIEEVSAADYSPEKDEEYIWYLVDSIEDEIEEEVEEEELV